MLTPARRAIGGTFELKNLTLGSAEKLSTLTHGLNGTWTASGRSALGLVLRHLKAHGVEHVHLPAYLCESILLPLKALGMEYSFYPVDTQLRVTPDPPPGSAVLLIHYFGRLNPTAGILRNEAGQSFYLIEDASQALLSTWSREVGEKQYFILSPRKFGPVPFGGWCSVTADQCQASTEVEALAWRSIAARLARGVYLAEPDAPVDVAIEKLYLEAFHAVEKFLDRNPMSAAVPQIALDLMAGLNWNDVAGRRRANWQTLHNLISGDVETIAPVLPDGVVPLGYVVRLHRRDEVRRHLAERRIFCPVHWRLPNEVDQQRFPEAAVLADTCLTLPIDQRYTADDMTKIVEALKDAIDLCR